MSHKSNKKETMVYRPKNQATSTEEQNVKTENVVDATTKDFEEKLTIKEKPKTQNTKKNTKKAQIIPEDEEECEGEEEYGEWDDNYEEGDEYDEYDEEGGEWDEEDGEYEEGDEEYEEGDEEYEEGDEEEAEEPPKPSSKAPASAKTEEKASEAETPKVSLTQELKIDKDSGVAVEKHVEVETEESKEIKIKETIEIKATGKTQEKKEKKPKEKIPQPQKVTKTTKQQERQNKSNKKQQDERPAPFSYIKGYQYVPKEQPSTESTNPSPSPSVEQPKEPQKDKQRQTNQQKPRNDKQDNRGRKEDEERGSRRGGRGDNNSRGGRRGGKFDQEREERDERPNKQERGRRGNRGEGRSERGGRGEGRNSRGGKRDDRFEQERDFEERGNRGGRRGEGSSRGGRRGGKYEEERGERRNNKEGGEKPGERWQKRRENEGGNEKPGERWQKRRENEERENRRGKDNRRGRGGRKGGERGEEEDLETSKRDKRRQMKPITLAEAEEMVKKGKYHEGIIRFNFKQSNEGYVSLEGEERDVCILGPAARNKSLPGDTVIFRIIPTPTILLERNKGRKKKFKDAKKAENRTENDEASEEEDEKSDEEEKESVKNRKYGRVVIIKKRTEALEFLGTFRKEQNGTENYKFYPNHKGVPLFAVNNLDLTKKTELFEKYEQTIEDQLHDNFFSVKFISWNDNHALGTIINNFGAIDRTETQYEVLKYDNNIFHTEEFPEIIYKQLPTDDWKITEKDLQNRKDLRNTTIFTIDPKTAKDLDDALSCELLEGGNFRVGVHIADVSHFVPLGSPLDEEARKRATTVYLAQENIPMLPRILADKLCSLEANVDRLAFSVSWVLTPQGDIVEETFFKSIICSARKFAYEEVHEIIAEPSKYRNDAVQSKCTQAIIYLDKLAKILKQKRYENGSLDLDTPEIYFEFDAEGNIIDVKPYIRYDSHFLIEEFMLLANISVAKKIAGVNSDNQYATRPGALLRRHESPQPSKILDFLDRCNNHLHLDIPTASTSKELHAALQVIRNKHGEDIMNAILHSVRPLKAACYIPVAQKIMEDLDYYAHFALHFPFYTHFTSPIRRYADLIVHHQLEHLLLEKPFPIKQSELETICDNCNTRKSDADYAQRQCAQLFLNKYLSERNISAIGIIVDIKQEYLSVYVPSFDAFKDIKLSDGKKNGDYNYVSPKKQKGIAPTVTIKWNTKEKDEILHLLDRIEVRLFHATERHFKTIGIKLVPPSERNTNIKK